ncbi:hypothetical protein [Pseudooceanicola nanhaiensis]|uniref:hypothetical protein n=1 Tax=Pseudooceanicola nanhaiensis TaxID=375761 RepID=UPI001CD68E35|nr:hypothetical protein [Pseudooceanicola nanhaiensis]MCA0921790.1 hypothetical protein [Pseudooceanicola nanhaiensis]
MSSELTLTKTRLAEGVWQGVLIAPGGTVPRIEAQHAGRLVEGVSVTAGEAAGEWTVRVPVPIEAIGDGVHTVTISEAEGGASLGDFSILSGEALADTLQAEVALLREELDMLKRAFRRHCKDTA